MVRTTIDEDWHAGLGLKLRVRLRESRLDRALASGRSPAGSRLLELRVRELASARVRWTLAASARALLEDAHHPPTLSLLFSRRAVLAAGDELLELAEALTDPACTDVRGVAMTSHLLCDSASPLYAADAHRRFRQAAREALAMLRGDA